MFKLIRYYFIINRAIAFAHSNKWISWKKELNDYKLINEIKKWEFEYIVYLNYVVFMLSLVKENEYLKQIISIYLKH